MIYSKYLKLPFRLSPFSEFDCHRLKFVISSVIYHRARYSMERRVLGIYTRKRQFFVTFNAFSSSFGPVCRTNHVLLPVNVFIHKNFHLRCLQFTVSFTYWTKGIKFQSFIPPVISSQCLSTVPMPFLRGRGSIHGRLVGRLVGRLFFRAPLFTGIPVVAQS